ncbi:MAG: hypothetical protein M3Z27_02450 [Actinomycetota bacterium]|nr:hypothetical protein [Actinomycetota bacterium]
MAKLGQDLGTVAGAIGLVAAIALCPADAAGLEGLASVLGTTGKITGGVGLAATGIKTGADAGQVLDGHGDPYVLGADLVGVAANGVKVPGISATEGVVHTAGAAGVASRLQVQSDALKALDQKISTGQDFHAAFSALTAGQKSTLGDAASALQNPVDRDALVATTKAELQAARTEADKLKVLNGVLHYGAGKANHAVTGALDPHPLTP